MKYWLNTEKRKRGRKNTILFWLFQVREEKREHKRRMKKLESIYKDNVRWKRRKMMLINVMEIYKDNVRWKSPKMSKTMPNINVMAIVRKMRSTLEKRLEKSAKSLEDQRREKQRKIARWLEPKKIKNQVWNVSGRVKVVVRDAGGLKSLKMTSKMAFNCGASRFTFFKEFVVQTSLKSIGNFPKKN